uniref:Protein kinase domain-containing protein n=1 Tax=Chromera velia CCMP2878 TaxID=1169474 RepID=A0A0G4HX40_9ALVE|eukprot:Cvel_9158.t1-p1 / transcript=Cvel_9158.t1 / gene=Cvel_9158 / organism=Chromera_velia_CCMP2878 / gene_product=hypothetical protein / transcript_product=hypothetical protein / location=Cvel_scaffold521:48057-48674(-) / protein_length=206 / sequence_SO=supercontig / SO=protein_coding / is_pseudo=false
MSGSVGKSAFFETTLYERLIIRQANQADTVLFLEVQAQPLTPRNGYSFGGDCQKVSIEVDPEQFRRLVVGTGSRKSVFFVQDEELTDAVSGMGSIHVGFEHGGTCQKVAVKIISKLPCKLNATDFEDLQREFVTQKAVDSPYVLPLKEFCRTEDDTHDCHHRIPGGGRSAASSPAKGHSPSLGFHENSPSLFGSRAGRSARQEDYA